MFTQAFLIKFDKKSVMVKIIYDIKEKLTAQQINDY